MPGCGKQGCRTRVKSGRHWTSHATGVARMTTRATPANLSLSLSEQLENNHLWISQSRSLTPVTSWSVSTFADFQIEFAPLTLWRQRTSEIGRASCRERVCQKV